MTKADMTKQLLAQSAIFVIGFAATLGVVWAIGYMWVGNRLMILVNG